MLLRSNLVKHAFITLLILGLAACVPPGPKPATQSPLELELAALYEQARQSPSPQSEQLRLRAATLLLNSNQPGQVRQILDAINPAALPPESAAEYGLLNAELTLLAMDGERTLALLDRYVALQQATLPQARQLQAARIRSQAYALLGNTLPAAQVLVEAAPAVPVTDLTEHNQRIWSLLSAAPAAMTNQAAISAAPGSHWQGWLSLASLAQNNEFDLDRQLALLNQWQRDWPLHPAANPLPQSLTLLQTMVDNRPNHITLMLPLSGKNSAAGSAVRDGFLAAYYQAKQQGAPVPVLRVVDTHNGTPFLQLYDQAVLADTDFIIGPLDKNHVKALQATPQLVPTLALNYGNKGIATENLFQFGLAAEDEARQVARQAWQAGHQTSVALAPDSNWGRRVAEAFGEEWQSLSGTVLETQFFSQELSYSEAIKRIFNVDESETRAKSLGRLIGQRLEHTPRRRQDVDFIFMAATPKQARQLVPTFAFHFAGNLPVYATSHIYSGSNRPLLDRDLDGVMFCETPWLLQNRSNQLYRNISQAWPDNSRRLGRLYALGIDSFRLLPRIRYLATIDHSKVHGVTGDLSIDDTGTLQRTLLWARMQKGKAQPLAITQEPNNR